MNSEIEKRDDLESIVAGLYYLADESHRCGLDYASRIFRASIVLIEDDIKNGNRITEEYENLSHSLLEIVGLLDIMDKLPLHKKRKVLEMLESGSLKEIH
jgi:hypothetical protein